MKRKKKNGVKHLGGQHHHCHFCTKSFVTVGSRNDHERNIHERRRPYRCEYCDKRFYKKFNLAVHKRTHSADYSHACKICYKNFKSNAILKMHVKGHTNQKLFMCEVCGKVFKTLAVLEAHSNIHTKKRKFNCTECKKSYSYRASLFIHMRTHTGERPYHCEECKASFMVKSHLNDHMRIHTQERPFECQYCHVSFSRTISLKKHLKSHIRAGLDINVETALLYAKSKAQSKVKDSSLTLDDKKQTVVSKVIQPIHNDDVTPTSRKGQSLDLTVESVVLYTNLPSGEDDLVTVVICNKNEEIASKKDVSMCGKDNSQKDTVRKGTNSVIDDNELYVSKVIKSKESSNCTKFMTVCETQDLSLNQVPYCKSYSAESSNLVCKSSTDWFSSQTIFNADYDDRTLVNNKCVCEDVRADYDIHEVLSEFDNKQSGLAATKLQGNMIENECSVNNLHFKANESITRVTETPRAVGVNSANKEKPLTKCKCFVTEFNYKEERRDLIGKHEKYHQRIMIDTVSECQPYVTFDKANCDKPSVVNKNLPFKCEICEAGFSFRSELRKHTKLHSIRYNYFCKKCNQAFQQEIFLIKHKCVSSDISSPYKTNISHTASNHCSGIPVINKETALDFVCEKCGIPSLTPFISKANDMHFRELCNKCQVNDVGNSDDQSSENELSSTKTIVVEKQNRDEVLEIKKDETCNNYSSEFQFAEKLQLGEKCRESGVRRSIGNENDSQVCVDKCNNFSGVINDMHHNVVPYLDESLPLNFDSCGIEVIIQSETQEVEKTGLNDFKNCKKKIFPKLLRCRFCPMLFKFESILKTHERTHTGEKPFSCPICMKTFSKKSNMEIHKRIHTGERSYLCDDCGKYFSYKYSLAAHKLLHTHELPFTCKVCGKGFRYESSRAVHLKRHMGNKAFRCCFCSKSFVSKVEMEDHKRTHTGERPYQCVLCSQSFSYRHHLVDHNRIHTGLKPYRCEICNIGFRRLGILKNHMQKHGDSVNH